MGDRTRSCTKAPDANRGRLLVGGCRLRDRADLQRAWGEWLGRVPWNVMVTGTFDEKRVRRPSQRLADKEAFWWCGLLGKLSRRSVTWIYVTERGAGGSWHMHALVVGTDGMSWDVPVGCWGTRNGHMDVRDVYDGVGAALYCCKSEGRTSEVVLSDTMTRYREQLHPNVVVALYPDRD